MGFGLASGFFAASNVAPYKTPCRWCAPDGFENIVVFGCFLVVLEQATLPL